MLAAIPEMVATNPANDVAGVIGDRHFRKKGAEHAPYPRIVNRYPCTLGRFCEAFRQLC